MASRLAFMQASRRALPGSTSALRRSLLSATPSSAKPTTALAAASNFFQNSPLTAVRWKSTSAGDIDDSLSLTGPKVKAPPMVYIAGEEMTHYVCNLIVAQWFEPYFDVSGWERYDLSCKVRDETDDQCLKDAVEAGKRIGAIFKEPTITPTAVQVKEFGLSKPFGSPNGAMRKGWNGITISRDTIHIEGIDLGKQHLLLFCFGRSQFLSRGLFYFLVGTISHATASSKYIFNHQDTRDLYFSNVMPWEESMVLDGTRSDKELCSPPICHQMEAPLLWLTSVI